MILGARSRAAAQLLLASVLVASCTRGTAPSAIPPAPTVPGDLLSVVSGPDGTSLIAYALSDEVATTVGSANVSQTVAQLGLTGIGTPQGWWFVSPSDRSVQTYEVIRDRTGVSKVGPRLEVGASPLELSVTSSSAIAADCHGVWALPLPFARRWSRIGTGCWGAPSPDGRSIAFSPDGHSIMTSATSTGGRAHLVLDVHDLAGSLGAGAPRIIGASVWGEGGLAFLVRAGDQIGVFVRQPDGRTVLAYREAVVPTAPTPELAWRPSGDALAIADAIGPAAVLRLFDLATGRVTALTFAPGGFAAMAWAPDGSSLAVLTLPGQLIIVDADGRWLLRRDVEWNNVLGWSGSS